ncbi:hypothetical protein FRB97_003479, partial [Tulasnella sp. 331]
MATTPTSGSHESSITLVAELVSLVLEGVYICLFSVTMCVMHERKVSKSSPSIILISLVFICNLAEAVIVSLMTYQRFASFPEGPDAYYLLLATKQIIGLHTVRL